MVSSYGRVLINYLPMLPLAFFRPFLRASLEIAVVFLNGMENDSVKSLTSFLAIILPHNGFTVSFGRRNKIVESVIK